MSEPGRRIVFRTVRKDVSRFKMESDLARALTQNAGGFHDRSGGSSTPIAILAASSATFAIVAERHIGDRGLVVAAHSQPVLQDLSMWEGVARRLVSHVLAPIVDATVA